MRFYSSKPVRKSAGRGRITKKGTIMKRTSLSARCLAIILCLALAVPLLIYQGAIPVSAWSASEGTVCSSRFGREIVGSDGKVFRGPDRYMSMIYDENGNTSYIENQGYNQPHMYLYTNYNVDEQWAYCIEAGVEFAASEGGYTSMNGNNCRFFANLPRWVRAGIMLATVYGFQHGKSLPISGINQDDYFIATQFIIWEYEQQIRTSPTKIADNGPVVWDTYYRQLRGRPAEKVYNWILEQMAQHSVIPSFTASSSTQAKTHTLKYNPDTRKYSLTLTDTNNSGVNLEALSAASGITVTRSGNKYTFTTSNIINNPISIKYRKDIPVVGNTFLLWGRPGYQTMCTGAEDPVQFYARFETESVGTLDIVKKGDDDVSVEGWRFRVQGNGVDKTVTTGADGRISVPSLIAGRYTVTELDVPDYYKQPESKTVDVLPGQTTEVQFHNQYLKGSLIIDKDSEQYDMIAGVQFRVSGVGDNGKTYNQVHTTDADGRIEIDGLYIGSYTITELGLPDSGIPSWVIAPEPQVVRVNTNQVSTVEFFNELKRGSLLVQKQSEVAGFEAGVSFRVYGTADCGTAWDKVYQTDSNGIISLENLLVGTYYVQEMESEANAPFYTAATQVVVVEQNNTTTVQPYNKLKRVPLRIKKTSYNGKNLGGIQFLVSGTTAAGTHWEHTYTTNEGGIVNVKERDADAPPIGTYTITEVESSVNIGYIIPEAQNKTFVYGEQADLHFYNAAKRGTVKVVKTDDLNNQFIEGRLFYLRGTSDSGDYIAITLATDKNGVVEFKEIPVGTYTLTEEGVLRIFVRPDPEEVQVVYAKTTEQAFENISVKASLHIKKTSSDGKNLEGIPFRITGIPLAGEEFACDKTFYTNADGEIHVAGLLIGTYSVTEVQNDKNIGYIIPGPQSFTFDEMGNSETLEFHNKLIQRRLIVIKRDSLSGQPIPGITFGLYDADGNELAWSNTDGNGRLDFGLLGVGHYTIKERGNGHYGYVPLDHDIEVEVTGAEDQAITIVVYNDRQRIPISVYKVDGTDKTPLAGAVFGLYGSNGQLLEEQTTGEDGYAHFTPREWGYHMFYTIKELRAPEGYQPSDKEVRMETKRESTSFTYTFENERIPCDISLLKLDGHSKQPLEGVEFGLYDTAGTLLQTGTTNAEGKLLFSGLIWGCDYQIRELSPLTGYLPSDPIDVTINRGQTLIELEAVNERRPVELTINKVDGETKEPLPGVKFGLYSNEGELLQEAVSDADGIARFSGLIWDETYYVKELEALEGYVLDGTPLEVKPTAEDTELEVTIENRAITGSVRVIKTDSATGEPLSGVLFALYDADGNELARGTTAEDGTLSFDNLRYGSYSVRELSSIDGYRLSTAPIIFEIKEDGAVIELELTNDRIPVAEAPKTGDDTPVVTLIWIGAWSIVLIVACVFYRKRRKKK